MTRQFRRQAARANPSRAAWAEGIRQFSKEAAVRPGASTSLFEITIIRATEMGDIIRRADDGDMDSRALVLVTANALKRHAEMLAGDKPPLCGCCPHEFNQSEVPAAFSITKGAFGTSGAVVSPICAACGEYPKSEITRRAVDYLRRIWPDLHKVEGGSA